MVGRCGTSRCWSARRAGLGHTGHTHVRAGEPQGIPLAKAAIDGESALRSVRARRQWLQPLAAALEARLSCDTKELARMARQVAATPP
ncbi:MAG: hypothetical protein ACRDSG_19140 [Pseudonocardiaceae bacterium]